MHYPMDVDDVPAARGSRPDGLFDVSGPQERVQRRTMEQIVDCVPVVSLLDVPVPQVVDQLEEVLKIVDNHVPEQVIDVPKITSHDVILQRVVLRVPQMAEQLVDVPVPEKVLQVSRGATSLRGEGTAIGGCGALATSSGSPQWASPPAQGGIQIRGNAAMVADVLVIMHDKFQQSQQSLPIDSEVPQFQFFDRVLDIPVVPQ